MAARLTFLIDTNVLLTLEPYGARNETDPYDDAARFARIAHKHGYRVAVHSATRTDFERDRNGTRRAHRLKTLEKYVELEAVPASGKILAAFPGSSENDVVDALIASALEVNAADYLVTEDDRLRRRVGTVSQELGDRVMSLARTIELLDQLHPESPQPPPLVSRRLCYAIELQDPIFDSLRTDYSGFDDWFRRTCQRGQREAFVIDGESSLAGICILKDEDNEEYGLPAGRLKLCTVKVAETSRRQRFGELLIKSALDDAIARSKSGVYVTVLTRHPELISLLLDLGFEVMEAVTDSQELVLWRSLDPPPGARDQLEPFEFNRRYGPRHLNTDVPMHIVPIRPEWDERLFPEGRIQLDLLGNYAPCGNGLRKAYLSRAMSTHIARGHLLLFYRSQDIQSVRFVAVVEDTLRSADPHDLARFVGTRTVYSAAEIEEMTQQGRSPVNAVLIRQARFEEPGWGIKELVANGVVVRPPQSAQRVPEKGAEWVRSKLNE